MKIFTSAQRKIIDSYTIEKEPVSSLDLMERAAGQCSSWLIKHFGKEHRFLIFAGFGNNGGDGLAVARHLAAQGYKVEVFLAQMSHRFSHDAEENLFRLKEQRKVTVYEIYDSRNFPEIRADDVVVDALFGSGLSKPLTDFPAELLTFLNNIKAHKVAIDIPSGLFGEENSEADQVVAFRADHTLTFQFPFISFFFKEGYHYTGEWHILPIGLHKKIIDDLPAIYHMIGRDDFNIKSRERFSHKGTYGHALIIAGSYGMSGAAVLSAKACLKTGAGLVTAHIPASSYEIMQTAVPEIIVNLDPGEHFSSLPDLSKYNAIGIGPGLGQAPETWDAFRKLIETYRNPLVIDADGLNILSENKEWLDFLPPESILTPHPKEFERLAGKYKNDYEQLQKALEFASRFKLYVILKGAFTRICCPDGNCWFNLNGNPGMATAGSGDVLTGIILSLLAQGYSSQYAAIIGVYVHGMAGDIAANVSGEEALIASDIINNLGNAFLNIKNIKNEKINLIS